MKKRSESQEYNSLLREKIIGLGERSIRKSYYPQLQQQLEELNKSRIYLEEKSNALLNMLEDLEEGRKKLATSETQLRAIVETTPDCILLMASDGTLLEINEAGLNMIECESSESITGRCIFSMIAPEFHEAFRSFNNSVFQDNQGIFQFEIIGLKGTRRWLEAHAVPLNHPYYNAPIQLAVIRDITDRKRAEEEVQKANDLLRAIIEAAPVAIIGLDLEGKVRSVWNPAAEKMLGWSSEEAMGRYLPTVPMDKKEEFAKFRQWIKSGQTMEGVEVRRQKRNGEPIDYSIYAAPLYNADRSITGNIAVLVDITERKQSEEALRNSEARFKDLFNRAAVPLCLINKKEGELIINSNFEKTFGYSPQEISTLDEWWELAYPDTEYRKRLLKIYEAALRKAEADKTDLEPIEYRITCKNGSVLNMVVYGSAIENYYLLTFFDVTLRIRALEELEDTHRQLERLLMFNEAVLTAIPTPVFYKDKEGLYLGCNRAFTEFMGISLDQLKGKTVMELWPSEYSDVYHKKDMELMHNPMDQTQIYEFKVRDKNGEDRPVIFAKNVFRDENNQVAGIVDAFMDITEQKKAEQERKAHLAFLENMDKINRAMQGASDFERIMSDVLDAMLSIFECDRAFFMYPCDPESPMWNVPMERNRPEYPGVLELGLEMPMDRDVAETLRILMAAEGPVQFGPGTPNQLSENVSYQFGFRSFMSMAIHPKIGSPWQFGMHQCSYARIWTDEEKRLFQEIGRRLEDVLTSLLSFRNMQQSEERYRIVADNTYDWEFWIDPEGRFLYSSLSCERITGYKADDFEKDQDLLLSIIYQDDRDAYLVHMHEIEKKRKPREIIFRVVRLDGELRWIEQICQPTYSDNGDYIGIRGSNRDVTDRKQAEEELEKYHEHLEEMVQERTSELEETRDKAQQYLDIAGVMLVAIDTDRRVSLINQKGCDVLGYPACDIEGKDWFETFLPENIRRDVLRGFQRLMIGEREPIEYFENPVLTRSGEERLIAWHNVILRDGEGNITGTLSSGEDITEQKLSEKQIQNLNRDLQDRAVALEAANRELEAFAYSVSHDLRAPLRHINGFMDLLKKKTGTVLDDKGRHYMDTISDSAKKMGQLIDDLLSFSRMSRQTMLIKHVDLGDVVKDVIRELEPDISGINITWRVKKLPVVRGDTSMLKIVITNLLSNAVKFSRQRKRVVIEIGCEYREGEIVIFVKDNGVGFDQAYADKLFGVFQRLHRADEFEGSGVGLAMVQRIILRHGGSVWAEGELDKGSIFYFSLSVGNNGGD